MSDGGKGDARRPAAERDLFQRNYEQIEKARAEAQRQADEQREREAAWDPA